MGNTVSAAELAATQLIHPGVGTSSENESNKLHHHRTLSGEIPPECPMHKKQNSSECPVKDEINPLNMVSAIE